MLLWDPQSETVSGKLPVDEASARGFGKQGYMANLNWGTARASLMCEYIQELILPFYCHNLGVDFLYFGHFFKL